jgi:prepilin-type N-terminal cleavage/methylation domain-containing protein
MWSNRGVAERHVAQAGCEPAGRRGLGHGRRHDDGFTLVELLIVVVLLGGAVVALLSLVRTTIVSSSRTRDLANAQAVLSTAGDLVTSNDTARIACTPTSGVNPAPTNKAAIMAAYQTAIQQAGPPYGPGWVITVTDVTFWNGTGFGTGCYEPNNLPLQRVTLRVATPNGKGVETIEVVKGNV